MKNILSVLVVASLTWAGQASFAAGTNSIADELKALVAKVQAKVNEKRATEADLAENLKEADALYARHKGEHNEQAVEILLFKVNLYLQVLDAPEQAVEALKQIKSDFPTLQINGNTDETIKMIQSQVDVKKLRDTLIAGAKFPDFEEKDLAGKPLSPAGFKGKVVLIDFWATWCPPCLMELPNIQKTYEKCHSLGFEVIGVSLDDNRPQLENFLKQRNMAWPQYFDGMHFANKLAVKYGVQKIPTTFLLDREGKIIGKDLRGEELEAAVAKALNTK